MNRAERRAAIRRKPVDRPVPRTFGLVVDLTLPELDLAKLDVALGPWRGEFAAAALLGRFVVIAGRPGVRGCLAMGLPDEDNLGAVFVSVHGTIGDRRATAAQRQYDRTKLAADPT